MNPWLRRVIVILATLGASLLTFTLLVYLDRPGWKSQEYLSIAFWTLPLAFLVLLVTRLTRRFLRRRPTAIGSFIAILLALVTSVTWTFLAVVLTGGYALAFDANPFFCWTAGSLAGFFTALSDPVSPV
jgi:hypothetical protein